MKRVFLFLILFPFFVQAEDEDDSLDKLFKLKFQAGVLAANYCHLYYVLGEDIFKHKENNASDSIEELKSALGERYVNQILSHNGNQKRFLIDNYKKCIKNTEETGEKQEP